MTALRYPIPIALLLGPLVPVTSLWSLKAGQYDDLDGAAERILFDDDENGDELPPPRRRRG